MMRKKEPRRAKRYQDDKFEMRECRELERNGSLTYVEDRETGERSWRGEWEIER